MSDSVSTTASRSPALQITSTKSIRDDMDLTNEDIKNKVENRLHNDKRFDSFGIRVEVDGGIVKLMGSAQSRRACALAQAITAGVAGVKTVDNRVKVAEPVKIASPTNEAIRTRILAALASEPDIAVTDLVVAVAAGVVFIDGFVEILKSKNRIIEIAGGEYGVFDVHNNLTVRTLRGLSGKVIVGRILAAIDSSEIPEILKKNINVRAENGTVTLEGTVPSEQERRSLTDVAAAIPGVVDIRNRLRVSAISGQARTET